MLKEDLVDYDVDSGRMRSTPRQVFLEVTSRCNLACVHCSRDFHRPGGHHGADMDPDVVRAVRPWLDRAAFVNLNGVGEPLLAAGFRETLALATHGPAKVSFNTNGLLLSEALCEEIVRRRVYSVVVSVDGLESNAPIRGVPWPRVRSHILTLDAAKRRAGARFPRIGIAYTLMRRNLHELPRLIEDLGPVVAVDAVHVQPLIVFYEGLRQENPYLDPATDSVIDRARRIAERFGTTLSLFRSGLPQDERHDHVPDEEVQIGQHSRRFGCIDPFYEVKIRSDGGVMSCSFGLTQGFNVLRMPLDAIWNHDWYRGLRRNLRRQVFEGRCRSCPYVFGSAQNQESALRPGVHHSMESRFNAGGYGRRMPGTVHRTEAGFLAATPDEARSRGLYGVEEISPGVARRHPTTSRPTSVPAPEAARIAEAILERLRSGPASLPGAALLDEDLDTLLGDLPVYEKLHDAARNARNREWNALTRRVLAEGMPFWVDRATYLDQLRERGLHVQAIAEQELVQPLRDRFVRRILARGGRVLVLGCDSGALSLELARHGLEVLGLDDNPENIRLAEGVAALEPALQLSYLSQDFTRLELPAESFAVICAWQALHHLEHQDRIVREIVRALRPDGVLIVQDFMADEGEHHDLRRLRGGPRLQRILSMILRVQRSLRLFRREEDGPRAAAGPADARWQRIRDLFPCRPADVTPAPITPREHVTGGAFLDAVRRHFPRVRVWRSHAVLDIGHVYPLIDAVARMPTPPAVARWFFRALRAADAWRLHVRRRPAREFLLEARMTSEISARVRRAEQFAGEAANLWTGGATPTLQHLVRDRALLKPSDSDPLRSILDALARGAARHGVGGAAPEEALDRAIQEMFGRRLRREILLARNDQEAIISGFHSAAPEEGCRWFDGDGRLLFDIGPGVSFLRIICRRGFRPDEQEGGIDVTVHAGDRILGTRLLVFDPHGGAEDEIALDYPLAGAPVGLLTLRISSRSFVPDEVIHNGDRRRLAFRIARISAR